VTNVSGGAAAIAATWAGQTRCNTFRVTGFVTYFAEWWYN
jgi:hypothetical protein